MRIGRNAVTAALCTVYVEQSVRVSTRCLFLRGLRNKHLDGAWSIRTAGRAAGRGRAEGAVLTGAVTRGSRALTSSLSDAKLDSRTADVALDALGLSISVPSGPS